MSALLMVAVFIVCPLEVSAKERSYTYNYDYWGDVQDSPDLYTVTKVFTSSDLGLETKFFNPEGIYVHDDSVFVCDTGNNRIIELKRTGKESLEVVRIIDSIKGDVAVKELSGPTDIAISDQGNYFICDKGNERILKLDPDLNYIKEYGKPNDSNLDPDLVYQPNKVVVDGAERVYCIATGINKGLIKYEEDGTFSGFHGATPASYDFYTYIWKKFATQEQLNKMVAFVPTEYDNISIDKYGFIYAVTGTIAEADLRNNKGQPVRKLNLLGSDILVRNGVYYDGKFPVYGDLYFGGINYSGPSYFSDVTVFDNDAYVCLDKNRGRLFCYDDQGQLIFACGGNGNMDGYFRKPISIDHMGYDLVVLDQLDCAITLFSQTDFGKLVFEAMDKFDNGLYDESQRVWEEVIKLNGNYDLAYIGLGRAYLRQKDYKTAMEYFKLKYDDENYSKAYRQYRKIWVEEHIVPVVIVLAVLILVPLIIGRIRFIKYQIATADIFKIRNNKQSE